MAIAATAAVGGPGWTDILTAVGTVAAAVAALGAATVAVWIALWTDRKASERLRAEHERSDSLLAEERAHAKAELEEERRLALEREQLTEAYAVQIVSARVSVTELGGKVTRTTRRRALRRSSSTTAPTRLPESMQDSATAEISTALPGRATSQHLRGYRRSSEVRLTRPCPFLKIGMSSA